MTDDVANADELASRLACRRIVRALIEKYDWALLSEDELVKSVWDAIQSEVSPTEVKRLATHHYTMALCEACRQARDLDRRERGYLELSRYLFRAASNRQPELAEDAAQRALLLVYEQIDRCRSPGAFLAFALYKLRHAYQQERRARGIELPLEEIEAEIGLSSADKDPATVSSHLDQEERLRMLLDAVKRLPRKLEQKVILRKFFGGWSDAEIAERLGITVGHVRVLRHRGLARLRKDQHLRDYFSEENCKRGQGKDDHL